MMKIGDIDLESGPTYTLTQSPDLDIDFPALDGSNAKRPVRAPRPIPDREPENRDIARYAAFCVVVAVILAVLLAAFFIGRATLTDDVASATESAARAEVLAGAATDEAAEWERRYVSLEASVAALASEVTSATEAAELWQQRAEDASATAAAVSEDNEALKRDLARIQQQKREAPATSGTIQASASTWQSAKASWYGSECFGNLTANGTPYNASAWGVAHRSLPFGTQVQISYNGKTVTAPVFDRGPFVGGREFDLSHAIAKSLGFGGVHTVRWRVM